MHLASSTIGIDFGTTNSVLAVADDNVSARVLPFSFENSILDMVRTALAFRRSGRHDPLGEAGPWAIDMFLEAPEDTRFLQSFKSFAASHAFTDTAVFARRFNFAQLLEVFLQRLREHAGITFPKRLVIGRPVTFAGAVPDERLAHARYGEAFRALGFEEVHFVLEPVAAAFFFAQRLTRPATVLVGDFGGGTSDFSIMRFVPGQTAQALAHAGVGLAGDTFDYRIIDNVVSPQLGKHATYASWGKELPIPLHYFTSFSRWNELSMMNRPPVLKALREFADASKDHKKLEAFIALIESGAVYGLYQAVAGAKAALSSADKAAFSFAVEGVSIARTITRKEFETWIAEDLEKLDEAITMVLARAGTRAEGIDRVFLTGGTSHVPAVRALFRRRFGDERVESGDELISIAKGLALIGARNDASQWAVDPAA
ncbi:MAG: Hsp70 family protein [Rhizobiales bacterium]|nr:Hsp70 family protein [Hyphomicrobiales bacterium]